MYAYFRFRNEPINNKNNRQKYSKINGVKTAIGDTGFYVDYGDEKATADMIKKALSSKEELGGKARERVKKLFNSKKKTEKLIKIVLEMI